MVFYLLFVFYVIIIALISKQDERKACMMQYTEMNKEALEKEFQAVKEHFEDCKAQNLKLNMARGKPAKQQLDIVNDIFNRLHIFYTFIVRL